MEIGIIAIVVGVLALFVLFVVARRVLRLAFKLALVGALILALIAGGIFWWWQSSSSNATEPKARPTTNTRRTTSNSR